MITIIVSCREFTPLMKLKMMGPGSGSMIARNARTGSHTLTRDFWVEMNHSIVVLYLSIQRGLLGRSLSKTCNQMILQRDLTSLVMRLS